MTSIEKKHKKHRISLRKTIADESTHLADLLVTTNNNLTKKTLKYIDHNFERDHQPIATKLGQIFGNIRSIIADMENVIVQLDKEVPYELSDEDVARIENDKNTREMFDKFAPYFLLYSLGKNGILDPGWDI